MKKKKQMIIQFFTHNVKRIIAAVVAVILIVTWCMTDFVVVAEEITRVITELTNDARYEDPFQYAVFAGDENNILCINANSVRVEGDVHTNKGFLYHGNTLEITETL